MLLRADNAHDTHTHTNTVAITALLCEVRCEAQQTIYDLNTTLELMDYGSPGLQYLDFYDTSIIIDCKSVTTVRGNLILRVL